MNALFTALIANTADGFPVAATNKPCKFYYQSAKEGADYSSKTAIPIGNYLTTDLSFRQPSNLEAKSINLFLRSHGIICLGGNFF